MKQNVHTFMAESSTNDEEALRGMGEAERIRWVARYSVARDRVDGAAAQLDTIAARYEQGALSADEALEQMNAINEPIARQEHPEAFAVLRTERE
jgi:hypothetical protein